MKRRSVQDRALDFAVKYAKDWEPGDMMEGEESKVQFWKWWGFRNGAAFGWLRGYYAGRRAVRGDGARTE